MIVLIKADLAEEATALEQRASVRWRKLQAERRGRPHTQR
jgi:hypothetical protein